MLTIKLDELIKSRNITQDKLSDDTGISQATISRWRRNKIDLYDGRTLESLLVYFDCSLTDLIEYTKEIK